MSHLVLTLSCLCNLVVMSVWSLINQNNTEFIIIWWIRLFLFKSEIIILALVWATNKQVLYDDKKKVITLFINGLWCVWIHACYCFMYLIIVLIIYRYSNFKMPHCNWTKLSLIMMTSQRKTVTRLTQSLIIPSIYLLDVQ